MGLHHFRSPAGSRLKQSRDLSCPRGELRSYERNIRLGVVDDRLWSCMFGFEAEPVVVVDIPVGVYRCCPVHLRRRLIQTAVLIFQVALSDLRSEQLYSRHTFAWMKCLYI